MQACNAFWAWLSEIQNAQWLEWFKVLVDFGKSLAWPVALLTIIYTFRKEIRELIPNIDEAGPGGIKVSKQQAVLAPPAAALQVGGHPLETVNALAEVLREELNNIVPEQHTLILIRALAEARVIANFESIFANIFKSQVDALADLEDEQMSLEEFRGWFNEHILPRNKEVFSEMGFENWVEYLLRNSLVVIDDNVATMTQKGIDFLDFARRHKDGFVLVN